MKKKEMKALITQLYEELMHNIDIQESEPNTAQVVNYLQDAIVTINSIKEDDPESIEHAKDAFVNSYKVIAEQGLSHYKQTSKTFQNLTQQHKEKLDECAKDELVDTHAITAKFEEIHTHMLSEVQRANEVITSLQHKIKTLEENSVIDSLTKVFNRKYLDSYLQKVCAKGKLPNNLHLLIIDIDDFKKINDTYGHVAGDKVLIFMANLLKKTLRDSDKIFRYGGEEFVIVLNRIDNTTCKQIAQRLIDLIANNRLIYKGSTLQITISIGATSYREGDSADDLIERADRALYKSKNNGKNQMNVEEK